MTAAAENLTEHVTMVEIDDDVAAVWQTLLHGEDWMWIAQQIEDFDLTYESVIERITHRSPLGLAPIFVISL